MDTSSDKMQEDRVVDGEDVEAVFEQPKEDSLGSNHVLSVVAANHEGSEHVISLINHAVIEQLKNWGIDYDANGRGRGKVRKSNSCKPGKGDYAANRLVSATVATLNITVVVPILIKESCDFLRKHIKTEGIFRKSGSSSRVQALMHRFGNLEMNEEWSFNSCDSAFDVATVLKQFLREMETPLIPYEVHGLFRRCLEVSSESSREEALLLLTCLLPLTNLNILCYLMEFFFEVVESSDENRMTHENLAIVIGPNIMPVESKKSEKSKDLEHERKFIEAHTKIVETMIRNVQRVGYLLPEIKRKIEAGSVRGSEDELENDGIPRRKKRRSGSLTRVLGFLRKVTSNKTSETPNAQTPGDFSDFTHTPIIKSGKRRCLDENIFSLQKKKTILDGIRKNGLVVKDDDKRFAHITDTPNSISGFITCPSPVCLNPSPMKMEWKQTPNAARFKNLVTPSLLRRKEKHADLKNNAPFSAPAKPVKAKLGLGKKSSKKQVLPMPSPFADKRDGFSREAKRLSSTMSIHKLAESPRKVLRASSTRIPRPDKINPVRKSNSSCRFPITSPRDFQVAAPIPEKHSINTSGEYVTLSPTAQIRDEKNEAFIASKISCLEDTENNFNENEDGTFSGEHPLRLTPLIQEINTLTLTAREDLTLSCLQRKASKSAIKYTAENGENGKRGCGRPPPVPTRNVRRRSSGTSNKSRLQSPPNAVTFETRMNKRNSGCRLAAGDSRVAIDSQKDAQSKSIRQVEDKFLRAVKETKIMRIQSENYAKTSQPKAVNIHRRFSVQDRGFSPSQRRIMSVQRRRSHELNRIPVAGTSTPLNSDPFSRFADLKPSDSISRSPNRCTLKRGRPNTLRSGLAKPSPASSRSTSVTTAAPLKFSDNDCFKENPVNDDVEGNIAHVIGTPLRRMSSVQELVKLMEKSKKETLEKKNAATVDTTLRPLNGTELKRTLSRRMSSSSMFIKPPVKVPKINKKAPECLTPKMSKDVRQRECKTLEEKKQGWVPASDFNFETHRTRFLVNHNEDRDSIQALKTLNAGKVSENVKLFDGMSRLRKSPGKSLIPRYVALHRQESCKQGKLNV